MEGKLSGNSVLIVQGSLIAGLELRDAFLRSGAQVYMTGNLISALDLLRRKPFDGAVVDMGLHNEAYDICAELQALNIPYICCNLPHRLQGLSARKEDAEHAVWKLANVISSAEDLRGYSVPPDKGRREVRIS
jgi:hypothetical protein